MPSVSEFDRVSLSPLRIAEQAIDLPFGLAWEQLSALLIDLDRARIDDCRAFERYELQGLRDRARSVVTTIWYPTSNGSALVDLFVKRSSDGVEAERHEQLTWAGIPLPRLLLDVEAAGGERILGFEFLDTIGIDFASFDEVAELLALVAALNALAPAVLGDSPLPPPGRPEPEFTRNVARAVETAMKMGLLGWATFEVSEWLEVYREAKRWGSSMPKAVTHGELYFQQVGRAGRGPLVLFDLATVGVRPRLSDLCSLIGGLARYAYIDEPELLRLYLDALDAPGAPTPRVETALDDLSWLRVLSFFQSLPWLTGALANPDLGLGALEHNVATLRGDLARLGVVG